MQQGLYSPLGRLFCDFHDKRFIDDSQGKCQLARGHRGHGFVTKDLLHEVFVRGTARQVSEARMRCLQKPRRYSHAAWGATAFAARHLIQ